MNQKRQPKARRSIIDDEEREAPEIMKTEILKPEEDLMNEMDRPPPMNIIGIQDKMDKCYHCLTSSDNRVTVTERQLKLYYPETLKNYLKDDTLGQVVKGEPLLVPKSKGTTKTRAQEAAAPKRLYASRAEIKAALNEKSDDEESEEI